MRRKEIERADQLFAKATKLDRDNHAAWFQSGVLLAQRGRWQKALGPLGRASELVRGNAVYSFHYGRALLETGELGAALKVLGRSVEDDPEQYQAHYFYGIASERAGDFRSAAVAWSESARLEPCFPPAFIRLAQLYERWQFRARAMVVAEKGLECQREVAHSRWKLWAICGRVQEFQGQSEAALACYHRALKEQVVPDLLLRRAAILNRLGFPDEARADLRRYLSLEGVSSWNRQVANERLRAIDASDRR